MRHFKYLAFGPCTFGSDCRILEEKGQNRRRNGKSGSKPDVVWGSRVFLYRVQDRTFIRGNIEPLSASGLWDLELSPFVWGMELGGKPDGSNGGEKDKGDGKPGNRRETERKCGPGKDAGLPFWRSPGCN